MTANSVENLYDKQSIQGTLIVSIDKSTFRIRFYESLNITVETYLNEEDCRSAKQAAASFSSPSIWRPDKNKTLDNTVTWGQYIDISSLPSYQTVPKTNQTILKAKNGQLIPVAPFDQVLLPKYEKPGQNKRKKRKIPISTITANESGLDGKNQTQMVNILEETEACDNVEGNALSPFSQTLVEDVESYQREPEQTRNCIDQVASSVEVLNEEFSVENPNVTKTNGGFPTVHYCCDCCKTFESLRALKDHRLVKNLNLSEFNCDECCEVFPFKAFLQVHKKSNHGTSGASLVYKDEQYWYSCGDCGALVKTLVKLQLHALNHTKEGYFQCCLCSEKFGEQTDLRDHTKCHKSRGMIRCRWCNKWFADRYALGKHKLICKEIKCHLCDHVFPNKTSRNQHYKDFHPNDILKCEMCTYMFSSQDELNSHMMKHSRFKKKQCTLCGLFFSRLKKHMLVHKNPADITENETFYCDKCPAKFTNQCTFNRHVQSHIGEKPYQCPNCPKTFSNCGTLYKHIKRHSSLLPYTCEACGITCESIDHLKTHMMTHSEDGILFPCSLCTQSFMYRISLETHMRTKHPQSLQIVPVSVAETESLTAVQQITAAAAFVEDPNAMMEVVIPDLTTLDNARQNVSQYEIVIVHKN